MFVVGLTGGIGSGKTSASDYLASKGITIVDADLASRVVVQPGKPALNEISKRFGAHMIDASGSLNRPALREIVFSDKNALKDLEAITHPAIRDELLAQLHASTSPYTVLVSPLLLETNQHELTNRVLLIDAPELAQVERTVARDKVPTAQVESIMAAQMQRKTRQDKADDVLVNDDTLDALHAKLDAMHQRYLQLATEK
ncbi:MAG: dephospho-CoA kinase [Alcanivoracaceae bacterium]|nr:dephospho-CoA kinase [Alcanivoracaceae bacterium]